MAIEGKTIDHGSGVQAPRLPLSFHVIAQPHPYLPSFIPTLGINIQHQEPKAIPPHIVDKHDAKVKEAASAPFITDTWKVNTHITSQKGLFNRNILRVGVDKSSYAAWYATGKSDMAQEVRDLVRHAGASVVAITADNLLMIQFRSDQNGSYRQWFGSGGSGSVDAKVQNNPDGKVDWTRQEVRLAPTRRTIFKETALKELKEETGLTLRPRDLTLLGAFETSQKPVDEFAFIATTNLTSEQIIARQNHALVHHGGDTTQNPMDKIGFIEASPHAVEVLLTKVDSPFNPTGLGTMLLVGRHLAFQEALRHQSPKLRRAARIQRANAEADAWFERVSEQAAIHYEEMNAIAAQHNRDYNNTRPADAFIRHEGLDPWVTPKDQGLKPLETALQDAGLFYRRDGHTHGERQFTFGPKS